MVSTFTPNIQWEEPARGDDVGTWDTPVNNNGTLIDLITGAITTIGLNNANVVLSAAQFRSKQITFNSTLTGSVTITFPTSFTKSYEIQNLCTGSSAFQIQLLTTAAGGQVIACPPGETVDVFNDGANLKFKNLGRIGEYWDYAGSVSPIWVGFCTIPPYLNCDGTSFSSATYPVLTNILGGTTLPDSRGRGRFALNQGTGRVTAGISGVDGNTRSAAGGDQNVHAHSHANSLNDLGHTHSGGQAGTQNSFGGTNSGSLVSWSGGAVNTGSNNSAPMSINNAGFGTGNSQNMPPVYIGGLTLIRAG